MAEPRGSNITKALARRLEMAALTVVDMERLQLALDIRNMRKGGKTFEQVAAILRKPSSTVKKFAFSDGYKMLLDYHDGRSNSESTKLEDQTRTEVRRRLALLSPAVVTKIEEMLAERKPSDAVERASWWKRVTWAMERVLKAEGLDQPVETVKPTINIGKAIVIAVQREIAAEDAGEFIEAEAAPADELTADETVSAEG